jgi:hypothetical protein
MVEKLIANLTPMKITPSLVSGRGALVVAELFLVNPAMVSNWNEVMIFGLTI